MEDYIHEDGDIGPEAFRNTQPMKADERGRGDASQKSAVRLH